MQVPIVNVEPVVSLTLNLGTVAVSTGAISAGIATGVALHVAGAGKLKRMSDAQPNDPSDTELAARMAQRDRMAFEILYDRYAPRAFGLIVRLLGDRTVGEDVLQECFWRAWQRAATFDPARASFSSWLLSIAHHSAIDELRRRRVRSQPNDVELDATEDGESRDLLDDETDVAENAWSNLVSGNVQIAMKQLPDAQRRVIELAYFGGFTRQEIAEKLNEPLGTVHTRARLGLLKLKELLAGLNA
jgi:RNA polymerase sigma-70 factor (ECF subfamily)